MTVVVTGAAGHIGNNLVRALLARREPVRAPIHRDRRAFKGLDVETVCGGILGRASLERAFDGADIVFHTAAHVTVTLDRRRILEAINVAGTRHVYEAAQRARSHYKWYRDKFADYPVNRSIPFCLPLSGGS